MTEYILLINLRKEEKRILSIYSKIFGGKIKKDDLGYSLSSPHPLIHSDFWKLRDFYQISIKIPSSIVRKEKSKYIFGRLIDLIEKFAKEDLLISAEIRDPDDRILYLILPKTSKPPREWIGRQFYKYIVLYEKDSKGLEGILYT